MKIVNFEEESARISKLNNNDSEIAADGSKLYLKPLNFFQKKEENIDLM